MWTNRRLCLQQNVPAKHRSKYVISNLMKALVTPVLLVLTLNVLPACNNSNIGGNDVDMGMKVDTGDMVGQGCGLLNCAKIGATCGPIGDGCGGVLNCDTCVGDKCGCQAPQTCGGGGTPFQCGGTGACIPKTCEQLNVNCGPVADGCGGLLNCGSCSAPLSCGGGGTPSVCGTGGTGGPTCTPKTCNDLGISCGKAGDGCGGIINCDVTSATCTACGCTAPLSCGAGGMPGKCGSTGGGCTPITCASAQVECGPIGDGCGNSVNCGNCTRPGESCGGGGVAGVCGGAPADAGSTCGDLCQHQTSCPGTTQTSLVGTVHAPNGIEPVPNALVYVALSTPSAFPAGVQCDQCNGTSADPALVSTTTNLDGSFKLQDVPCGANLTYNVVIQLGRWRRIVQVVNPACCVDTALADAKTKLPSTKAEGDIPLIAVVTGKSDPIECVLPKIGISLSEFSLPSGTGRVRLYRDNGVSQIRINSTNNTLPSAASNLYNNLNEMKKYDAIIVDCVGGENDRSATEIANLKAYMDAGGRVFASHFAYVWLYKEQLLSTTAAWNNTNPYPSPDTVTASINTSFPKGQTFSDWLELVGATPTKDQIQVNQARHDADSVVAPTELWMTDKTNPDFPLEFTFNTPVGAAAAQQCGRVLFSDFHVNTGGDVSKPFYVSGTQSSNRECPNAALTDQEKVLEYLLFDLTSCITPTTPPPPPPGCTKKTCADIKPPASGGAKCGVQGDGCGGTLDCGTCTLPESCGGGGTPNVCGGSCTQTTCAAQGFMCGSAADGCGGLLDCGPCPSGQTCGGGGVAGQCGTGSGCTAQTCASLGYMCGPAGDGCGNTLQCGDCTAPDTCGGGGTPGKCGSPPCNRITCALVGANCGVIGDGCGSTLDCGTCPGGQRCGGSGAPNVCGSTG